VSALFLGVDGGQSGTTAWIGDDAGRVLGCGTAGPCNHVGAAEGGAKLAGAVSESVAMACAEAGLDARSVGFEAACFGMSGGPEDKREVLAAILRAGQLVVTHDALIALSGATAGEPGIVTIAGTGSIAFGRNAAGAAARAGGWGYIFGDEGGAFDIVRQALRASLRSEEGWGAQTALGGILLEATGSRTANGMLHAFYTSDWPRARVAALAPLVDAAARQGDRLARDILERAAQELATLAGSVRARLWPPGQPARASYVGGVFRSPVVLERFRLLVELEEGNSCAPPVYGPAAGALLEAYRAAGLKPRLSRLPAGIG